MVNPVFVTSNLTCHYWSISDRFVSVALLIVADEHVSLCEILRIGGLYGFAVGTLLFNDPRPSEELEAFFFRCLWNSDGLVDPQVVVRLKCGFSVVLVPVDVGLLESARAVLVVDCFDRNLARLGELVVVFDELFGDVERVAGVVNSAVALLELPADESVSRRNRRRRCSKNNCRICCIFVLVFRKSRSVFSTVVDDAHLAGHAPLSDQLNIALDLAEVVDIARGSIIVHIEPTDEFMLGVVLGTLEKRIFIENRIQRNVEVLNLGAAFFDMATV